MLRKMIFQAHKYPSKEPGRSGPSGLPIAALVAAITIILFIHANGSQAQVQAQAKPASEEPAATRPRSISSKDLTLLKKVSSRYRQASSVTSRVSKSLKLGLLGKEKQAAGQLWIAGSKFRMELDGSEKTLLIINKKNLWAITYPDERFKGAAIQVIRGEVASSQARSRAMIGLLTQGDLLKYFEPTGVLSSPESVTFFFKPKSEPGDIKRVQLKVSSQEPRIDEVRFWDGRDNETQFKFEGVTFGKKIDNKIFDFKPPQNADVMNL